MKTCKLLKFFSKRLRTFRLQKGLTQEELSFEASLARSTIAMVERQKNYITLSKVEVLAKALNVEVKDFFEGFD